jgi:hypothetical protein
VAAHVFALAGDRSAAVVRLRESLELHPYHPNAMLLAASLAEDERLAADWRRAAEHVLDEASHGFELPYPEMPGSGARRRGEQTAPPSTTRTAGSRSGAAAAEGGMMPTHTEEHEIR